MRIRISPQSSSRQECVDAPKNPRARLPDKPEPLPPLTASPQTPATSWRKMTRSIGSCPTLRLSGFRLRASGFRVPPRLAWPGAQTPAPAVVRPHLIFSHAAACSLHHSVAAQPSHPHPYLLRVDLLQHPREASTCMSASCTPYSLLPTPSCASLQIVTSNRSPPPAPLAPSPSSPELPIAGDLVPDPSPSANHSGPGFGSLDRRA